MNETFIEQLACAFRKVGTIHTVGEEWHSYTGEIPVGGVPYLGHLVTRETYSALFAYAEAKGLVKTEAEWMELSAANNGNVPFYSDGDGSTTFRMPKIVGYFRGASTLAETGSYVAEGLPNITGEFNSYWKSASPVWTDTNAFDKKSEGDGHTIATTTTLNNDIITFDASRSNPIYGNSTHVIPETSVVLFGVYAFGAFCNVEDLDATKLSNAVATVEAQLAGYLPLSGGTMTGQIGWDGSSTSGADTLTLSNSVGNGAFIETWNNGALGARLVLRHASHATQAGVFGLDANDGTNKVSLIGKPDGTLTWNGQSLLSGVNVKAYVTETWRSGNSWYRKWSDGWIEQGGLKTSSGVNSFSVTLNTAFTTTNYTVVESANGTSHEEHTSVIGNLKTSSFSYYCGTGCKGVRWYACGY